MKRSSVVAALGALAQETRLDIFRILVQKGPQGLSAGDLAARLKQPAPTLSFHLSQLRFAGLVVSQRASRSIIYRANYKAMKDLLSYLTENCCGGDAEVCAPDAVVCVTPEPRTGSVRSGERTRARRK